MSRPLAVIVGAGIAGLAAAWQLNRIGWRTLIVERAIDLRSGGYMLGLSGPGYETAVRMGLQPALQEVWYNINENVYRDRHGRELLRLRYRDFLQGLPYHAVRRDDLIQILNAALPPEMERRFGVTLTDFDARDAAVHVTLSDGTCVTADLMIGADGFRSALRQQLFGADDGCFEPLGYRFAVFDIDDPLRLEADFLSYAEPGHLAEYYALRGGRLAAMHVWRDAESAPVAPEQRWAMLQRVAADSHSRVRDFIGMGQAGPPPTLDSLILVNLPQWSQGRVVLLGDAAHCLTLVSGQGAGMAIASAEILAQELAQRPVMEALAAHDARLRPSITRLQQRSRRMAALFIPEGRLAFHLRNITLRLMPRAWLGRYLTNAIRSEIGLIAPDG